jgi:uncharacterized protein with GYD domain
VPGSRFIAAAPTPPAGAIFGKIASLLDRHARHATRPPPRLPIVARQQTEDPMLFICSVNWTDQGIRNVKDSPKRAQAARDLAKKLGVDMKELYLTSGDTDLVAILETANGDNVAKFAMAIGATGNVRTKTARAWTQAEMQKMISELP